MLYDHIDSILYKKIFMGIFDSMVVKYGAVVVGYTVLGLPVFGPNRNKYASKTRETSDITRDYIRNSSLLINLAKAIGRIVVSYKEVQSLAGYTLLVHELKQVLDDLSKGNYDRVMVKDSSIDRTKRGTYVEGKMIKFEDVPLVTPNGDVLIKAPMNFEIQPGMNLMISGPNGCGKSSLFRILGGLWPLFGGKLTKPAKDQIFYIPQRPYLPNGTLRD